MGIEALGTGKDAPTPNAQRPTPPLQSRSLSCGHGARAVLEGVDLLLAPGEVVVLLGQNGSGKSTLLSTLAGTLRPLAGEVSLGGDALSRLSRIEIARRVAFVPQEEAAAFGFLVREVVTLGRLPRSTGIFDTAEDRRAAEDAMRQADCEDLADRPVTQISGGEGQRALLARALAQDAPVLLLDEPTSHLDVGHRIAAVRVVRALAEAGRAVLAAVHDLDLASALADRAILLANGRVSAQGPVREVLESPALDEAFGARFTRWESPDGRLRVGVEYGGGR